ncbi:MAG TPA: leucyl/phenylalanyl-tRNA--protein transferase [Blastocatellia bacterium]|nr:leucyl/phenylalanyl-tRNA--protein transferase [Blastocatellia bacterium]
MKKLPKLFSITPEQVLAAYQHGMFPMARGQHGDIHWYISEPRAVLPLDRFKIRRSLQKAYKHQPYRITFDTAFAQVIRACARHHEVFPEEVWLSDEMIDLYIELHRRGHAHSVEVWRSDELVGGLYGIAIQAAFFGESMFSRVQYASQFALLALVERLRRHGFLLLDTQVMTPHLKQFGAIEMTHDEYMGVLVRALREERRF